MAGPINLIIALDQVIQAAGMWLKRSKSKCFALYLEQINATRDTAAISRAAASVKHLDF